MLALGILVATGVFVGWVGSLLMKKYPGHPPLAVLGLYTMLVFAGGFSSFTAVVSSTLSPVLGVSLWSVVWIPTLYAYSQLVGGLTAKNLVDGVFASSINTPARSSHGRAKRLILQGHLEGAKQTFLNEFHAQPKDPEPLLTGARLMANAQHYGFAMDLYRETLAHFSTNTAVWSEATWLLSGLMEEPLNMPNEAVDLWRQIVRRSPNSTIGRLAGARLQERVARRYPPAKP